MGGKAPDSYGGRAMNDIPRFRKRPPPVGATTEGEGINAIANARHDYPQRLAGRKTKFVFRSDKGQEFAHRGKAGRVLQMLATRPGGITQYGTYPWHTRLGASIHLLRQSGLAIETIREGECRHARYRLITPGKLVLQSKTGEAMQ